MVRMCDELVRDQEVFVGIDVSKRSYAVAVRAEGRVVFRGSFPSRYEHLRSLWRRLPGCRIHAVYEAGFSGFGLYDELVSDGIEALVTPPSKVPRSGDRVKTDRVDAQTLARELEKGSLGRCRVLSPVRRAHREFSRYLGQLVSQRSRLKNQLKMRLLLHGIHPVLDGDRRWSRAYREEVTALVSGRAVLGEVVGDMLDRLQELDERVARYKRRLRSLTQRSPYRESVKLYQSVPGIGWLTAIRLDLEWGDLSGFPSARHFASYLGLTPSEHSTGERTRRGRITCQGNGAVRAWLVEAAWKAITRDPALGARFRRLAKGPTQRKRAIVAVARTLAVRLRACGCRGEPYVIGLVGG